MANGPEGNQSGNTVRVQVVTETAEGTLIFKLDESETSTDFTGLLPLEVTLEDYASAEKIAYLPRKLAVDGAPDGYTPVEGDLAYYAPWGNLAMFHKDFSYSCGLVKLGSLVSGMETLRKKGTLKVRIALAPGN